MLWKEKIKLRIFSGIGLFILSLGNAEESFTRGLQRQEKHEVEVRLVLVDVVVTKGGDFYRGLKAEDFELYNDGIKVPINSCDLIFLGRHDPGSYPQKELAVPTISQKKRLAVLLDSINVQHNEFKKTAQLIIDELVSMTKSGTEVMVLCLDRQKGLRIVQPFTNREDLLRAAVTNSAGESFPPYIEYLDYDDSLSMGRAQGVDAGIGPLCALEHLNRALDKFGRTVSGLLACFHMLETFPGRKCVLFVSCGFPDIDNLRINHGFSLNGNIEIFDPFGILSRNIFPRGEAVLNEIIQAANARNISIHSLDASTFSKNVFSGPSAEFFDQEGADSRKTLSIEKSRQIQNLKTLSERTGATILRGADKIDRLREVERNDLGQYYQLSYYPPKKKASGTYHKIEVRVKGRDDIRVRYREGYSDLIKTF